MTSVISPLLVMLVPDCCGERLYEDGYADALMERGILAESCSYSESDWPWADRYVARICKMGVTYLIYPSPQSEIYHWHPTEPQMRPRRPRVDRTTPGSTVGIVELVDLLEAAGIRTAAMDMHFSGPFDFEATFYGPPERFIGELQQAFPELAEVGGHGRSD